MSRMWKRDHYPSLTVTENRIIKYQPRILSANQEDNGTKL